MHKILFASFLIFALTAGVIANSYGLLIGIDRYKSATRLGGAVADAVELEKLLKRHGIHNTVVLLDNNATKQAIVTALKSIAYNIKRGDLFYMFFSGHGTSLEDKGFQSIVDRESRLLTLLENSGALLPYDFDKNSASRSLLIGSRDLRPLFEKIDAKGALSLVVFDACFSGMSYRSLPSKRKRRRHYTMPTYDISFNVKKSHPYKSLVYVASTSASDWAVEDTKTHRGYLMQQLEYCLNGTADSNGDKRILKQELKHCIDNSDLPQSPQVYPDDLKVNPQVFKVYTPTGKNSPKQDTGVSLSSSLGGGGYIVQDQYGKIASFSREEQLRRYREAYKIMQLKGQKQFSLQAINQKGVNQKMYTVGDEIDITVQSSREGYLVLFDLDAEGNLFMIEPYPDKFTNISKNKKINYTDLTIAEPVGVEIMKGFIVSDLKVIEKIQQLSPNNDTGLIDDPTAIYQLLSTLPKQSYDSALLKLTTYKK
ncbi:MAG: caspase family protein [Campylobacterota bacterium]|nr:caspase family protein [Campylobacterota bacterium]